MKKKFVLVLLMTMTCLTGCVEYKATMDIKSDKSMNFAVDYAIDKTVFGEEEVMDSSDKKKLENDGFTVEKYEHDNMKGYHITKKIKNIDSYSSNEEVKYNLSGILNEETKNDKIFKVKKGIFKNTYYATLEFDASDSGLSDNEAEEPETSDEEDDNDALDDDSLNDLTNSLMSNLDLSFNLKLPSKAISHNASTVNNDGKELKWDLSANSVDTITFSFSLYNTVNIIICIILVIVVLVTIIILIKKKKSSDSKESLEIDKKEE